MSPIAVPASFLAKLVAADAPLELLASDGTLAGYFCPCEPKKYTQEELERVVEGRGKSGIPVVVITAEDDPST